MQPLIDADVLLYEVGFGCETGWKEEGKPPFDYAAEMLDNRIANTCAMVGATSSPILFLTGKTNFRTEIAKRKNYKERPSHKPFHYYNLKAYIKGKYDWRMVEGLEADDLMAIEQTSRPNETIICTRDKDLRQVEGWHYGWELGNQPQFGPLKVEGFGHIELDAKKKLRGYGMKFFFSQLLTGDSVDTVPGLKGCGPVKAFSILENTKTPTEALKACYDVYKQSYGMFAYKEMLEQARLVWMVREVREDGTPILWGQTK